MRVHPDKGGSLDTKSDDIMRLYRDIFVKNAEVSFT